MTHSWSYRLSGSRGIHPLTVWRLELCLWRCVWEAHSPWGGGEGPCCHPGGLRLVAASPPSLLLLSHGLLPASVSLRPLSCEDTSHRIGVHPTPASPHLNLVTLAKTLLPNKVTRAGTGRGHQRTIFRGEEVLRGP